MRRQSLLQIELNEFDPDFLRFQAQRLGLKNTLRFLDFERFTTMTDDIVEHQGLDPWVQWVNVHTGMSSADHGIKRLGDTGRQSTPQIWETIANLGYTWAAWGVMNAPMGDGRGCATFMPDPWSFEEQAYPVRLNQLLALPRYMARNYLAADRIEFLKNFLKLVQYYAPPAHWPTITRFSAEVMKSAVTVGVSIHTLTTLLDYLGALEFTRMKKRSAPDFSVIFLNHIAHLQHQFWPKGDALHPEMKFGLQINNLIMGMLMDSCAEDDAIIIMNGLRQKNVAGEGWFVYRQINPQTTVSVLLGHERFSVEQCMTHDAHIRFENKDDAALAFEELNSLKMDGFGPLLFVERIDERHLFIQLSIEQEVPADAEFFVRNASVKFHDMFELVCERTGAHIPQGDVFARNFSLPPQINNHEIYDHVLSYFGDGALADDGGRDARFAFL